MPRFVVLEHSFPPGHPRATHWDLMLERGAALATWALDERPEVGVAQSCRALDDHRVAYLDYEGAVSGNRGRVRRIEQGTYELLAAQEPALEVRLAGALLEGRMRLAPAGDGQRWILSWPAG